MVTFEALASLPILQRFYRLAWRLFGVNIGLMNREGKKGVLLGHPVPFSPFCARLQRGDRRHRCLECDLQHLRQALTQRKAVRYHCFARLTEFIIPIVAEGEVIAFLQCGQVLDQAPTAADWERTASSLQKMGLEPEPLRELFFAVRVVTPEDQADLMALLELFSHHLAQAQLHLELAEQSPAAQIIRRTQSFIREHLDQPLTLQQIARAGFTSPRTLTRLYKQATGDTLWSFVHQTRISRACHLLTWTEQGCLQIAQGCGFPSIQHFNRVFRRLMKTNPRSFRRSHASPARSRP